MMNWFKISVLGSVEMRAEVSEYFRVSLVGLAEERKEDLSSSFWQVTKTSSHWKREEVASFASVLEISKSTATQIGSSISWEKEGRGRYVAAK